MDKIKILMHTQPNITSFNAQDLNGREIASRLNSKMFEIYFIDTLGTEIDPKINKPNIHILRAATNNKFLRLYLLFKYKLLHKYHVSFYIRVFKSESMFLRLLPIFDKNRKTIHTVENMLPYPASKKYNKHAKFNALHSTMCFSISTMIQKNVEKEYGLSTSIIPVGVDTSLFTPDFNKNNKRLKILSVGTFQKRKQPELFANIARKFSNCDFYWVGEGELKDKILRKKEEEGINNLFLLNNMPHKVLSKFMSKCDIFLFPSIHEGFPKVLIEAMASGLPVIAFNKYGPEAIVNNKNGFIVSSEKEMIEKLKILIEDKELRDKFSRESVKRAKKYDWKIIVSKWEEVLKNIVNMQAYKRR